MDKLSPWYRWQSRLKAHSGLSREDCERVERSRAVWGEISGWALLAGWLFMFGMWFSFLGHKAHECAVNPDHPIFRCEPADG